MGDQVTEEIADKYIILELDSFRRSDSTSSVSAFCLIENVPIMELAQVDQFRDLHAQMIKNFRQGNWKFCEDALEHLVGRWNGEADSFYLNLRQRLEQLRQSDQDQQDWDPSIKI